MIELDHVIVAVSDLDHAASTFLEAHGLGSIPGGRHPGWGTANRIVPLGESYLELIAVIDEREASATPFGRRVSELASARGHPLGWAVRPASLAAVARKLGLTVETGSRTKPDGEIVRWRAAGVERAVTSSALPFFLEWAPGSTFPGSLAAGAAPGAAISRLELEADPAVVATWLGHHSLPVHVQPGERGLACVVLNGRRGEVVLGGPASY